ncbi:MAG: hypothetical protein OQK99_14515 [Gammaproteobacteria bacterium]|jgi:hypothetical protein|nr:hypothetical protein [Gammaproteobacteria bacterium]
MIIEKGSNVHFAYRALFEGSNRRHFLGEVVAAEGTVCRLEGYAFVYDPKTTMFERKPDKRTTIANLAESGYIVNILDTSLDIDKVVYEYKRDVGLIATDHEKFTLNINEFGARS